MLTKEDLGQAVAGQWGADGTTLGPSRAPWGPPRVPVSRRRARGRCPGAWGGCSSSERGRPPSCLVRGAVSRLLDAIRPVILGKHEHLGNS